MKRTFFAALACGVLMFGGCEKDEPGSATTGPGAPATGPGTIVVRLTDAPGAYDAVNIVVDSIRVHVESGDTINGWYTISHSPATYDLLDYMNGRDTIIAGDTVPAGYYSQMRLYIGQGSNVTKDGVSHPLVIPSGSQSGLKLNIQASISPGVQYALLLDFDASRSIVVTGNGRYMLKPVIRTVATAVSGSLMGKVVPDTTHATVWAIAGTDTSGTFADSTGAFAFRFLSPATYLLRIVPADTTYRDTTLANIVVAAAQSTNVGMIVLQKK
jgi:hypothetical protein